MNISKAVVPLLAAGFCTHCVAGHAPELITMLDGSNNRLAGRLGPDGYGVVEHFTSSGNEIIRFGPDGVTNIPLPSQVVGVNYPYGPREVWIVGVGPGNASTTRYQFPSTSYTAGGVLDASGFRAELAPIDLAGPGVPLVVDDLEFPRSMNTAGNAIVEAGVGSIATYGPEIEPRLHRVPGTPTPGLNAVFGVTPPFLSPGRERTRKPQFALDYDISSGGQVAYMAMFSEDGGPEVLGIFVEEPGADRLLLRDDATNARGYRLTRPHNAVRVNAEGHVALLAELSGPSGTESGIWSIDPSGEATLRIGHLEEFQMTSAGGTYRVQTNNGSMAPTVFRCDFVMADNGDIAFGGVRDADPGHFPKVFVFSGADGVNRSLLDFSEMPFAVREYNRGLGTWVAIAPDARSVGAIVRVNRDNGVHVSYATIVVGTVDHGVVEVVRTGDLLKVGPDEYREVQSMQLLDHGAGGYTLFRADFIDYSRALFVHKVTPCRPDLNNDGVVDADDFFLFLQWFADADPRADINGDGVIDAADFYEYLDLFAQGC
ncbi:MAG: dockerin type I repeat-containing protein [Phycisphaerales bacterium]|nr:dockerin type I repeat-containing protein [Phycisphaerales bacterium]